MGNNNPVDNAQNVNLFACWEHCFWLVRYAERNGVHGMISSCMRSGLIIKREMVCSNCGYRNAHPRFRKRVQKNYMSMKFQSHQNANNIYYL